MKLRFSVSETATSPLWDFGWFDLTRFTVDGLPAVRPDGVDVLRQFLRDPISQRSFCTYPDPWGTSGGLHGPFPIDRLAAEWYRRVAIADLQDLVAEILDDPEFTEPPSRDQRVPVSAWLDAARLRGDDVARLEPPEFPGVRVEWDVWLLFHEFVCFSPTREELTVAVIGYD